MDRWPQPFSGGLRTGNFNQPPPPWRGRVISTLPKNSQSFFFFGKPVNMIGSDEMAGKFPPKRGQKWHFLDAFGDIFDPGTSAENQSARLCHYTGGVPPTRREGSDPLPRPHVKPSALGPVVAPEFSRRTFCVWAALRHCAMWRGRGPRWAFGSKDIPVAQITRPTRGQALRQY